MTVKHFSISIKTRIKKTDKLSVLKYLFLLLAITFGTISCEEVVNIPIQSGESRLVVHGLLTNNFDYPNYVTLSRSWDYTYNYISDDSIFYEENALVVVSNDSGDTDTLYENHPGTYLFNTNVLALQQGRYYQLYIRLADSTEYISEPEFMDSTVNIDNIYYSRNKQKLAPTDSSYYGLKVFIDMQDPSDVSNYYLRLYSNYYKNLWHFSDVPVVTLNDKTFNGNYIKEEVVYDGYAKTTLTFKIQQFTISYKAYTFWTSMLDQKLNGGIFSFPVSPIFGNVRNLNDSTDFALGYFQVSSVSSEQIFINQ